MHGLDVSMHVSMHNVSMHGLGNTTPVKATMAMTSRLTCIVTDIKTKRPFVSMACWQGRTITSDPDREGCVTCVSPLVKPENWV